MVGASHWWILRRHLLPHLVPTVLVWGAIAIATNWLPPSGYCPLIGSPQGGCSGPVDWASHLALPWLTFALPKMASM